MKLIALGGVMFASMALSDAVEEQQWGLVVALIFGIGILSAILMVGGESSRS